MASSQFDWYKLSLLDDQKPDLQKFQLIIRNANVSKGIDRVPTSYRKKLLTLFQTLSTKIKYETKSFKTVNQSLAFKKNAVADRLEQMENNLQDSKHQLVGMKSAVAQKKKMAKKLTQKIETLKKNKTQQTYFCPFCSRNDFISRQIFSFHMFSQHQTYKADQQNNMKLSMPNNSLSTSAHNELKEFIMTLKDKEMEMMKMILSQKKELQTQELERVYEREMNSMTIKNKSQPEYLSRNKYSQSQKLKNQYEEYDVDLGSHGEQLHGDSQFLFYQKSQKYKQAAQRYQYSIQRVLQERKKELNRHPYYDIFKEMEENKSLDVEAQQLQEQGSRRDQIFRPESNKRNYAQDEGTSFKILSRFNLKQKVDIISEQKTPVQPLKMTSTNLKFQEFNPSITDRLKQEQNKKKIHSNTIYSGLGKSSSSKGHFTQQEYVFNSGPLVDDKGGYSDYEDYFGSQAQNKLLRQEQNIKRHLQNESINFSISKEIRNTIKIPHNPQTEQSIIEDQEIKLNPGSYSFVSRSSFSKQHISQLLSPSKDQPNTWNLQDSKNTKNKYSMYYNSHQKSSQIVDLSDSFSRRDFELSKDESSINLSDLKLSKLQKKKAQQKQKEKQQQKIPIPTYSNPSKAQNSQIQVNFVKKPLQFMLISEEKPFKASGTAQNQQKINLLNEFEKKLDIPKPLVAESYNLQKKETYQLNEFYKQAQQKVINKNSFNQNSIRPSNLNEFIRSEFSGNENRSPNVQQNQQDKAFSPHEFFANSMKKNSSYGSLNQNQASNKLQSYVSQSSVQTPKVDLSQFQKVPSLSQSKKRQAQMNFEKIQSSENTGNRLSRSRKRLQRHDDLEDSKNNGFLNEFFKKEFQDDSSHTGSYQESQGQRNQGSYRSTSKNSASNLGLEADSQSYSRNKSRDKYESLALDEFIK